MIVEWNFYRLYSAENKANKRRNTFTHFYILDDILAYFGIAVKNHRNSIENV